MTLMLATIAAATSRTSTWPMGRVYNVFSGPAKKLYTVTAVLSSETAPGVMIKSSANGPMKFVGLTKLSVRGNHRVIDGTQRVPVVRFNFGCSSASFQRACSACVFATVYTRVPSPVLKATSSRSPFQSLSVKGALITGLVKSIRAAMVPAKET